MNGHHECIGCSRQLYALRLIYCSQILGLRSLGEWEICNRCRLCWTVNHTNPASFCVGMKTSVRNPWTSLQRKRQQNASRNTRLSRLTQADWPRVETHNLTIVLVFSCLSVYHQIQSFRAMFYHLALADLANQILEQNTCDGAKLGMVRWGTEKLGPRLILFVLRLMHISRSNKMSSRNLTPSSIGANICHTTLSSREKCPSHPDNNQYARTQMMT